MLLASWETSRPDTRGFFEQVGGFGWGAWFWVVVFIVIIAKACFSAEES